MNSTKTIPQHHYHGAQPKGSWCPGETSSNPPKQTTPKVQQRLQLPQARRAEGGRCILLFMKFGIFYFHLTETETDT